MTIAQPSTGQYDPQAANWQPPEQPGDWNTFQNQLRNVDPMLDFFVKHPHFVEHMVGVLVDVLAPMFAPLWKAADIVAKNLVTPFPAESAAIKAEVAAMDPRAIISSLGLSTDAFMALLTEHQLAEIQQMHEYNHGVAVQNQYAHYDPNQGAYMSPWGYSHPGAGGQMQYQSHQGVDPYAQSHYPNQPIGMQNPYQPAYGQQQPQSLTGALFGLGASYMTGQGQGQPPPRY